MSRSQPRAVEAQSLWDPSEGTDLSQAVPPCLGLGGPGLCPQVERSGCWSVCVYGCVHTSVFFDKLNCTLLFIC